MEHLEKEVLAFALAVLAVVAGLAVFYYAELDKRIVNAKQAGAS